MAWVFKKDYPLNALDGVTENENSFFIYPNPASNQLFIKTSAPVDQEFSIINLLGEKILSGSLNGPIEALDVSKLSPDIYMISIDHNLMKFVKIE